MGCRPTFVVIALKAPPIFVEGQPASQLAAVNFFEHFLISLKAGCHNAEPLAALNYKLLFTTMSWNVTQLAGRAKI